MGRGIPKNATGGTGTAMELSISRAYLPVISSCHLPPDSRTDWRIDLVEKLGIGTAVIVFRGAPTGGTLCYGLQARGRLLSPGGLAWWFACYRLGHLSRGRRCDQEMRPGCPGGVEPPLACRPKSPVAW